MRIVSMVVAIFACSHTFAGEWKRLPSLPVKEYEDVFVLEALNGEWKKAGKLLRALGYGVSVTHGGGVMCVSGSDSERQYADVFRLEWKSGKLVVAAPSPAPVDPSGFRLLGGDDSSKIAVDAGKHRGFVAKVLHYDNKTEKWLEAGDIQMRPGIRSPEIWRYTPEVPK